MMLNQKVIRTLSIAVALVTIVSMVVFLLIPLFS